MLRPYRVVLPDGYETVLLLTKRHKERDFPNAVLVDEEASEAPDAPDAAPVDEEASEALGSESPNATPDSESSSQEEKPKTTRRTRKSS